MKLLLFAMLLASFPALADDAYYSYEAQSMRDQNAQIEANNQREQAAQEQQRYENEQNFQQERAAREAQSETQYVPYGQQYVGGAPGNPAGQYLGR